MKKRLFLLLLTPMILASCQGGNEPIKGSPVYTVTYFDEVGTEIGYSYAIKGKAAVFKDKDGNAKYDYLPRLKSRDEGINASYYVFDGWAGTYEDGSPIDIFSIQADCSVNATFARKEYSIGFRFKSEGKTLYKNTSSGKEGTILYDLPEEGVSYESVSPSLAISETMSLPYAWGENPELLTYFYYQIPSFKGFSLKETEAVLPIEGNALSFKAEVATFPRNETPALDPKEKEGTFLLNLTKSESGVQDYPTFYSDGDTWTSIGSLSSFPILNLNAKFDTPFRPFDLYAYASEDDAKKGGGTPLVSLPYGASVTFEAAKEGETSDFLVYQNEEGNDIRLALPSKTVAGDWTGFCYGFDEFNGSGKPSLNADGTFPLDPNAIIGTSAIYPKVLA